MNEDYFDMFRCLIARGVDFLLVGGHAVSAYGYFRSTFDLDIWILATPANAQAVYHALNDFGAPMATVTPADFVREGFVFQIGVIPRRIDILNRIDGVAYEAASQRARDYKVADVAIKMISLDDLITNKLASGRGKDLADAQELQKIRDRQNG